MGDLQSKPVQNLELLHLEQQYEPFSKGKSIPGEPIYLKLNSIFQKSEYCDKINNRFKKLERYNVYKRYTEQGLQADKNIYEFRRTNLPCIVQVVYYCIEKQECQCSNNAYKLTLYTEHVETRLAHYKATTKIQSNHLQAIQYYDAFTLDEAIYVLISVLHAYELLSQQFIVNYPTPFSIGINYKAQVKVWVNENWSINQENHRRLSENIIIEELINMIEERMHSNFNTILNATSTYMNFTFSSIQEMLSRYTINFQKGKKSLEDRLNNRTIKDRDKSNVFSEKIPLSKSRQNSVHTNNIFSHNIPENSRIINTEVSKIMQAKPTNQKRYFSQENVKKNQQIGPINGVRNYSNTPRTTVYESPKKIIKFFYQPTTSQQSPRINAYNTAPKNISPFPEQLKPQIDYKFSISDYRAKSSNTQQNIKTFPSFQQAMIPSTVSADYFDKNTINSLIDRKIKSEVSNQMSSRPVTATSNVSFKRQAPNIIRNVQYNFDKYPKYTQQKSTLNPVINAFEMFPKEQRKVQFDHCEQYQKKSSKELNKTSQNASLTEITEQFKNLLKSDHKIEQKQELFYNYNDAQQSLIANEEKQLLKQPEENTSSHPYIHSFQEIKQQDQDVSYSVDQLI